MNTFISRFSFLLFYFEKLSQPRVVLTLLQNLMMMIMMMMMMMMMMMTCFCGMVNRQNAFSRISRLTFDTPRAGLEPAQNLGSGFIE